MVSAGRARPWRILIALVALAGIGLIADGIWIKAKALVAQILLERSFEQAHQADTQAGKPWSWADMRPIARLSSARLGQSVIVLDGAHGEALAFGPGHLAGTPLPGETGTSVLAGHRDTHFSWIGELEAGETVTVERTDGRNLQFQVRRAWIARFDDPRIDVVDDDERLLVLSTCYPLDGTLTGPLRYIVEAALVAEPSQVSSIAALAPSGSRMSAMATLSPVIRSIATVPPPNSRPDNPRRTRTASIIEHGMVTGASAGQPR